MEGDPLAVALKFGFLAVLYLFLFAVARSALRDLRGRGGVASSPIEGTGMHEAASGSRIASTDGWLVVVRGGGLDPGEQIDVFGGVTIGRSTDADVRIEDRYASGIHCRIHSESNRYLLEDLESTNGTLHNGDPLVGEAPLSDLDEIAIGDTEFRFELSMPDDG